MLNAVPKSANCIELNNKLLLFRSNRSDVKPLKKSSTHNAMTCTCSRGIVSKVKFSILTNSPRKNKNIEPGMLNFIPNLSQNMLTIRSKANATSVVWNDISREGISPEEFSKTSGILFSDAKKNNEVVLNTD